MSKRLLGSVLSDLLGEEQANYLTRAIEIHPDLLDLETPRLTRAQIAQLLNMQLLHQLFCTVPDARRYADEQIASGRQIVLDHGALRTVALNMRVLPPGKEAFARILEPLGYAMVGEYPLDTLRMCGFVYCHRDFPESIAQYFVSELYTDRFSTEFENTVHELVYESRDPLSQNGKQILEELGRNGTLDLEASVTLLRELPGCFARQHGMPTLEQYKTLLSESAEMAWIATEGNVFNHATDRVTDLDQVAEQEKAKGRAMKPEIEEGKNARIRQTAYRAASVTRQFVTQEGVQEREVPGSFFEFIQRGRIKDSRTGEQSLDLRFDSRNAQGIFTMTRQ